MQNLSSSLLSLVYGFDPEFLDVGKEFFAVAGKYAMIFGIMAYLIRMVVRASTGKERFM